MPSPDLYKGAVVLFDTAAGRVIGTVAELSDFSVKLAKMYLLEFKEQKDGTVESVFNAVYYASMSYTVVWAGVRGFVEGADIRADVLAAYDRVIREQEP